MPPIDLSCRDQPGGAEVAEVAVVGLGLIGAAACRHLAAAGVDVLGIGSDEPAEWELHDGVFASHYDSGRITRRLDVDPVRAELAVRSIPTYRELEAATGRRIHRPVGCLFTDHDPGGVRRLLVAAHRYGVEVEVREPQADPRRWCHLEVPPDTSALLEPEPAGFIDPRALRGAQVEVAGRRGARVVTGPLRGEVAEVAAPRTPGGRFTLTTRAGERFAADRVLVCGGAFSGDLAPLEGLDVLVTPEEVVLGEVSEAEAVRCADMPALLAQIDHPLFEECYLVPPTRYPDGRWYLKLGANLRSPTPLASRGEKVAWMRGVTPSPERMDEHLRGLVQAWCPDVAITAWSIKRCLITDTPTGLPYLGRVPGAAEGLWVATGGNGFAAKSSDAIGRLAADWVRTGVCTDPVLDAARFEPLVLSRPG